MNLFKSINFTKTANYSLFIMSFFISSLPILSSITIVIFIIITLSFVIKNKSSIYKKSIWVFAPIILIFGIFLISFTYSPNIDYGIKIISRSLMILILPLVFWLRGDVNKKEYLKTIYFFIIGVFTSCLVSLLIAVISYFQNYAISVFTYYELAEHLRLHPTYFSLFILSALVLLQTEVHFNKLLKMTITVVFLVMLVLLQSRIAVLSLLLFGVYLILTSFFKNKKALFILGILFIIFIGAISSNLRNRIKDLVSLDSTESVNIGTFKENGINQRIWLWSNAIKQIKKQPILGFGLGSQENLFKWQVEKDLLGEKFNFETTQAALKLAELNLHNQYLQFLYESGIIGLLLFISFLIALIRLFYQKKNFKELLVFTFILIFMLTENIISRQMGIHFFAFMLCFFLSKSNDSFSLK